MLGSALNEQGGGLGLYFLQEHGGIPPTPPFRRVLAGTDGNFGGGYLIFGSLSGVMISSFSRRLAGEFIEYGILTLILVKAE